MDERKIINKLITNFINDSFSLNFEKLGDDIKLDINGRGDNVLLAYMIIGKKIFKKLSPTKENLILYQKITDYLLIYLDNNNF